MFLCPHCNLPLTLHQNTLSCPGRHSFDLARQGYVHLLPGAAGQHGDDRPMVLARRDFLEKGYYQPLCDALCAMAAPIVPENGVLLDAGCGEGWYTAQLLSAISPKSGCIQGIDVSREAVKAAGTRFRMAGFPQNRWELAVASSFHLPVADGSVDALTCVFAPTAAEEFARVLTENGSLIRAVPLPDHLWELKSAVYETAQPNDPTPVPEGFTLADAQEVRAVISLPCPEDIRALFYMTPYAYRTDPAGKARLDALETLETRIAFRVERFWKMKE